MKEIPKGYEEIFGETRIQEGDRFLNFGDLWVLCSSSIGKTVSLKGRRVVRKITRPLTPEEQIKHNKRQSRNFVNKYIPNPTPEVYEKFELAFLREDKFGL